MEEESLAGFKKEDKFAGADSMVVVGADGGEANFALLVLGKRRRGPDVAEFVGLESIPLASAHVERTVSKASVVLTKSRNRLYPITLEALLFLKENWQMVTVLDVQASLGVRIHT